MLRRRLVYTFAYVKGVVTTIYLVSQVVLLHAADDAQKRTSHVYAPELVILAYSFLAALYVGTLVQYGWTECQDCLWLTNRTKVYPMARRLKPRNRLDVAYACLVRLVSSDVFVVAFNTFELTCQSYEAFELSTKLVDRSLVSVYISLVALHAIVKPCFWQSKHSTTNVVLLTWMSSWISFSLSCLVHFFGLILPLLHYKFVDSTMVSSPRWLTHYILYVRYNFVTSLTDLIAKVVCQLGSLVSLWRLVGHVELLAALQKHPRPYSTLNRASPSRTGLNVYLLVSVAWGITLFANCQCMFVHVNCPFLGHQDVDLELQARQLGSNVFAIVVSRCDLHDGIANSTLRQFEQLYFLGIHFTNMTSWDGQLPPSINFLAVSYSQLTTLPSILEANLPSSMVALRLSNLPLHSLEIPPSWSLVRDLRLVNVSRVVFYPTTLTSFDFVELRLAWNNLTSFPLGIEPMNNLAILDVSGNALDQFPQSLLSRGVQVVACGNAVDLTEFLGPLHAHQRAFLACSATMNATWNALIRVATTTMAIATTLALTNEAMPRQTERRVTPQSGLVGIDGGGSSAVDAII
ncbi:hypothetical protein Ae201684P_014831 [Aphanomyces euteiches]|nr:hypothetical protein Ae201684P_014640 [Aphanomyces euteiches]KAH9089929.1 hypothetical protein Ae201684P_014684 [Aphanomyces euteiches]KAH9090076.1 hypothetical protein Ae201684P_014831 [Aphanomyces euteiches]